MKYHYEVCTVYEITLKTVCKYKHEVCMKYHYEVCMKDCLPSTTVDRNFLLTGERPFKAAADTIVQLLSHSQR